ncbi:hypothetical protein BC939DRAFT_525269 [Gamsiella multidivaricata]|uniref:uncharacterized protein n=1 Tax=Gamsiella multidivaricata TaxID=101098 RepID=UPI00221F2B4D|nr:uncharacterized protein BC939DRAFT_525269 [Gamsiella multidivaricata]KAG0364356.1 hypothetical protein BGZ54_007605 [Gamsiella multidivaricata]KAI7831228.1 hypothetical protein BC939DRAFT_525269 [Gamsiella multidivaricata]
MTGQFSSPGQGQSHGLDLDSDSLDTDIDGSAASNIGPPPAIYMANLISKKLLRIGASMFGRREDASCVLIVGARRYYVHVQILASRSPTFQRIFDDMITNNAWGVSSDEDFSSAYCRSSTRDGQDCDVDDAMVSSDEGDDFADDESTQEVHSDEFDHEVEEDYTQREPDLTGTSQQQQKISMASLSTSLRHSLRVHDEYEPGLDEALPELRVTFADPEGSRFDELLYWLYTSDNERWVKCFTPENYGTILENIARLRITTDSVLNLCLSYEATTRPELGLRGMAMHILGMSSNMASDVNE